MMLINICLIVIFGCLTFIVLSKKIEMKWFAKLVMCFMMISIIGIGASLNSKFTEFEDISWNIFFACLAFLSSFVTYWTQKRGGYR